MITRERRVKVGVKTGDSLEGARQEGGIICCSGARKGEGKIGHTSKRG